MGLADIATIVTLSGVIGTLVLGFLNLSSARRSERLSRSYLRHKEKTKTLISLCTKYISMLKMDKYMVKADTIDDYGNSNRETQDILFELETLYYQILLHINGENPATQELEEMLKRTVKILNQFQSSWSLGTYAFLNSDISFKGTSFEIDGEIVDGNTLEETRKQMMHRNINDSVKFSKEMEELRKELVLKIKEYLIIEEKRVF